MMRWFQNLLQGVDSPRWGTELVTHPTAPVFPQTASPSFKTRILLSAPQSGTPRAPKHGQPSAIPVLG